MIHIKLMCHTCRKSFSSEFMVSCMTSGCNLMFCHKCLTSKFKYSRAKAESLPTTHWKCPVCSKKCKCNHCSRKTKGIQIPIKKAIVKPISAGFSPYHKQRIQKSYGYPFKIECLHQASQGEKETQIFFSPDLQHSLPSISSIIIEEFIVFPSILDTKTKSTKKDKKESPILTGNLYENMNLTTLLNLASIPISILKS